MRRVLAVATTIPLLAAPVLVATPAQADSVVKRAKLQKNIKSGFKKQAGVTVKVKCPKKVRWAKGKIFYCKVKANNGNKYRVQVRLGSESKGRLNWKVVA